MLTNLHWGNAVVINRIFVLQDRAVRAVNINTRNKNKLPLLDSCLDKVTR